MCFKSDCVCVFASQNRQEYLTPTDSGASYQRERDTGREGEREGPGCPKFYLSLSSPPLLPSFPVPSLCLLLLPLFLHNCASKKKTRRMLGKRMRECELEQRGGQTLKRDNFKVEANSFEKPNIEERDISLINLKCLSCFCVLLFTQCSGILDFDWSILKICSQIVLFKSL